MEYYINPYIMYLSRLLRCQFREALNKEGLFAGQHELLVKLYHSPGVTATRLAKEMDLSLATVSVSIKRLERAGFVAKQPDLADNRMIFLFLTDKGRQVHDSIRSAMIGTEATLLEGISEEEINQFRCFLKQGIANLGGICQPEEGRPPPREAFEELAMEERRLPLK